MIMSKSRLEKFLYALYSLDSSNLPTPLSRIEELYKCWVTGEEAPTFEPLSRVEKYLMAILGGYDVDSLPNPLSRVEVLLYKLATGDDDLDGFDTFLSKHEELLAEIIRNGGVGGDIDIEYVLYTLSTEFNTLYNTAEKPVKSAILKGDTLVNLIHVSNFIYDSGGRKYTQSFAVKPGTKYLLRMTLSNKNAYFTTSDDIVAIRLCHAGDTSINFFYTNIALSNLTTESINTQFITNSSTSYVDFIIYNQYPSMVNAILIEYEDGMENWDIPYFEGMKSVKMPVLITTGKNLFDGEFKASSYSSGKAYFPNGTMKSVSFPHTTTNISRGIASIIKVKPNTSYTVTISNKPEKGIILGSCYENVDDMSAVSNAIMSVGSVGNDTITTSSFTTTSNCNYMVIGCYAKYEQNTTNIITFNEAPNIQLEESSATEYEPHKSTTVTCNEEVELRGIGDVKDELNLLTGELTQRIGEVVLDGSESWIKGTTKTNVQIFQLADHNSVVGNIKKNSKILCDKLKVVSGVDEELITLSNTIYIGILKTKASTVDELTAYLSQNPITFQHQVITESIKTVDLSVVNQDGNNTKLSTLDDITYVILSSEGLIPEAELEVATKNEEDLEDSSVYTVHTLSEEFNTLYNTAEKPVKSAILKGNTLVNIDIPYFEGMQSVKMPVLKTTGKNLLNPNWQLNTWYPFKLKSGTKLTLSTKDSVLSNGGNIRLKATDETDVWMGINEGTTKKTITLQKDVYKLSNMLNGNIEYQLEIGGNTPYEPYKSNILTTSEEVELRGIGTSFKDELNLLTGELTKRVGEIVLDGSENWSTSSFSTSNTECVIFVTTISDKTNNWRYSCDRFKTGVADVVSVENVEGICSGGGPTSLFINVSKTKASTVEDFKNWLSNNNVTVQYQSIESVKTVDLSVVDQDGNNTELKTFNDITHVTLSSEGLIPEAELEVAEKVTEVAASMLSISREQEIINTATNEQSENVDSTMIATTEIYEGLL